MAVVKVLVVVGEPLEVAQQILEVVVEELDTVVLQVLAVQVL